MPVPIFALTLPKPIAIATRKGLAAFRKPSPLLLSEWAARHFYLSPESSYVEGRWQAYPYQIPIMNAIGNDDIQAVTLMKSARVGYTKMILAAMAYFATHKRRNQCVWQPVDDDADEFVKTEIDTMIRDVPAVQAVFPWYNVKSKHNTLRQKTFLGSILHIRGGKSAKNYRRLTLSVAYQDEADGFDADIEQEGPPDKLIEKRLEGATFKKLVCGSTPTLEDTSIIARRIKQADGIYRYHIPCPHCGEQQTLQWGGKHEGMGFKWLPNQPETVAHLCPYCAATFTQNDYLQAWEQGIYRDDAGNWTADGVLFFDAAGQRIPAPRHIGFHVWTAYSPQATWAEIVRDWIRSKHDPSQQRFFINTTLGETWKEQVERTNAETLLARRENYGPDRLPARILYLTAGADVQEDRLEIAIYGWRQDSKDAPPEAWLVEKRVIRASPALLAAWTDLDSVLLDTWRTEDGRTLRVGAGCIDSGGHHTAQVYAFCESRTGRHIYATKGKEGVRPIWPPKASKSKKYNAKVWLVGADSAKDAIYARLRNTEMGPGYIHFPTHADKDFFSQLTSEQVRIKLIKGRRVREWFLPKGKRNEDLDCAALALAALLARPVSWSQLARAALAPPEAPLSTPAPKSSIRHQSITRRVSI
ncbi:MAG: terminase gpA endonuclease subunit [Candidatus Competibacter denitrificans]